MIHDAPLVSGAPDAPLATDIDAPSAETTPDAPIVVVVTADAPQGPFHDVVSSLLLRALFDD